MEDRTRALLITVLLFAFVFCVVLFTPETQYALINEEKVIWRVGETTITAGDLLTGFSIFGSAVTIGLFFSYFTEKGRRKK